MSDKPKRSPMAPAKLSPEDYTRKVAGHLKNREGAVPRIYTDDKGIPTMGTGIALATKGDGETYTLRDLDQIGAEISGDRDHPYQFSETERKLLTDTVEKLNDKDLTQSKQLDEIKKLIPAYKPGKETAADNKFGFTLSDERIAQQGEAAWNEHRNRAMQIVRTQATARGWSKEETDAYIDSLKGSQQEIALTSLAYNGVPTPKATRAMLDGDPVTMRQEILYRSNGDKSAGIADRRKDEADMASGKFEDWTPEQREQWRQVESTADAKTYRDAYPKTFPRYDQPSPPPELKASSSPGKVEPQSPSASPKQEKLGWWETLKDSIPSLVSPAHAGTLPGSDGVAPPVPPNNTFAPVTEEQRRSMSGAQQAILDMSSTPIANPGQAALLKPVEKLTEGEMMDMIHSAQGDYRGWRSGDPLKAHTYEKVQDWHVAMYGDAPQGNDGGKPIEPTPIRAIPDQSAPHVTPQGEDLWQATGRIGKQVAEVGQAQGMGNAVTSLQRGLNMLNAANPLPARSPAYAPYTKLGQIVEDGAYGPQTDFALKHATARLGPTKVEDAFALGRFNTFARNAQKNGTADGLENATHGAFGALFRDPADSKAPKLEGGVLQETLNDLGSRSHDDWEPLKVDNWIGPKTTDAFGRMLKTEDADSFTSAFGRGLGLL